jgi:hypothetical protein
VNRARAICLAALVAAAPACSNTPPDATGVMERPAGLLVVPRTEKVREDLFIADSEAQGVRLQQFKLLDGVVRQAFALAPAVFFPLVIPARGFPTELALAPGQDRLHVLSPAWIDPAGDAVGALHVLEIEVTEEIEARASTPSNVPLGSVSLSALGLRGIPVDVEVLTASAGVDRVAVLIDDLGQEGQLAILDVTAQPVAATVVAQAAVGRAPRQMAQVSPGVLAVALSDTATTGAGHLAWVDATGAAPTVTRVDVGGPISQVIPVANGRSLALRLDRASVVVLEADGTVSTEPLASPHTPVEERGTAAARGRIDLARIAVAGASGAVSTFPNLSIPTGETREVVMLTLLDGSAVFLAGDTLAPQVAAEAALSQLRKLSGEGDPAYIRECQAEDVAWCIDNEQLAPVCPGLIQVPRADARIFRAVYRGDLLLSRSAVFSASSRIAEGVLAVVEVPEVSELAARLIAPGDAIQVQALLPSCASDPEGPRALNARGTVQSLAGGRLDVLLTDFTAEGAGPDALECLDAAVTAALVEVFPAGEEAVLQRVSGETPVEIQARVPVVQGPTGQGVARFEVRPDGLPTDVAITLASPTGFTCVDRAEARRCTTNVDCGAGRACAFNSPSGSACPGTCDAACGADAACLPGEQVRGCSGVELTVGPTLLTAVELGDPALRTTFRNTQVTDTEVVAAVPYATVWLPIAQGWVTSFPGSRDLVFLRATSDGFFSNVTR